MLALNWGVGIAVAAALVITVVVAISLPEQSFLVNTLFLITGAIIATAAPFFIEQIKRPILRKDLCLALHMELADRLSRCCFDSEAPWKQYVGGNSGTDLKMTAPRLRKFKPVPPLIYPSIANQLTMIGRNEAQAVILFYFRLTLLERDIDTVASNFDVNPKQAIDEDSAALIAKRFSQTLEPGLKALQALGSVVDNWAEIEKTAIAPYDDSQKQWRSRPSGTLRERIALLISPAAQLDSL